MRSFDLLPIRKLFWSGCVVVAALATSRVAPAQGTILHAIAADANTNDYLPDASVTVDPLGLKATTDFSGDTRFAGLRKGHYKVHVRKLGYAPIETDVDITGRDSAEITFSLRPVTHELATVTVEESAVSPVLREFEERRKRGLGHYVTDSVLRESFASPLQDIIGSRLPGLKIIDGGDGTYLINSTRGSNHVTNGGVCPVSVYWNGVRVTNTHISSIAYSTSQVGAIEFYNPGTVPVQYQWPGQDCGVLLLWPRP